MTPPTRLALLILIILLAGAGAAPAFAGEFSVVSCNPASGHVNRAWTAAINHGSMTAYVRCPPTNANPWEQGLIARHASTNNGNATVPQGAYAAMVFTAPPGASLVRMSYEHRFCGFSGFTAGIANAAGTWLHHAGPASCGTLVKSPHVLPLNYTPVVRLMAMCTQGPCPINSDLNGYATMHSVTMTVRDLTKPSLSITGGTAPTVGWKRGVVDVAYRAVDNVGVKRIELRRGAQILQGDDWPCDYTRPVPCPSPADRLQFDTRVVPDGSHVVAVVATDAAQNASTANIRVNIDNDPPGSPSGLGVVNGSSWRQRNSFDLSWNNPPQPGTAPVAGVAYAVCPSTAAPTEWSRCTFGRKAQPQVTHLTGVTVPGAGEWDVRVWLWDAAGNEQRETAHSVRLRLDNVPPVVAIGSPDPTDPTRIDVVASDSTSGLSRCEIEIKRRGDSRWLPLATTQTSAGCAARLDDERMPDGVYELRARAIDNASNERSTALDRSGTSAIRSIPARINTRLAISTTKRPISFGSTVPIHGRLTMPGGNPVQHANIEVWEQITAPGAVFRRVALVESDSSGRFTFKALRGPSRTLRFRYPGTPLVRARTTHVAIQVKATTTFRTNRKRVVNGEEVVLRGQVLGRPLPRVGKLLQLQAYSRGRWITFATPRANASTGRWSHRYRFTSTRGTVRYRFRTRVPREAGFPYTSGVSRQAHVVVRGL